MRKIGVCAVLGAIGLMAASGDAFAAIVMVNCTMSGVGALATQFATGGTAGTEYQVSGTCNGGFNITQDNITIDATSLGAATIIGEVAIIAAKPIVLRNLIFDGSMITPVAAVVIEGPAFVTIAICTIQNSLMDGIQATGPSRVKITASTIQNSVRFGVVANTGATVQMKDDTVKNNQLGGIVADQNSTVTFLPANTIDSTSAPNAPAVIVLGSSSVILDFATVTGPADNHTIFAALGSSVLLRDAHVTATTPFIATNQLAVITAANSSAAVLAGGNTITNSAAGGAAVILSDGSSLIDVNGTTLFGFTAALDTINGRGIIHTQSVIELASSSGMGFGVTWTGNILVNQASSFRADGGNVMINGTVTLDQSANGYFNNFNGTVNDITSVVCKSTTDHVSNPNLVTPPITIGAPPGCALF